MRFVLLDAGWNCEKVATALFLDDDTIRKRHCMFLKDGFDGLLRFEAGGSACWMSGEKQEKLKAWVSAALPRLTRQIGAGIEVEFGLVYEGSSGLMALLNRLGLAYHKPAAIPRKLHGKKQRDFIESYERLMNSLTGNEAVLFVDAVHPTTPCAPPVAGARPARSSPSNRQAGVSASTFTAPSICRLGKPG